MFIFLLACCSFLFLVFHAQNYKTYAFWTISFCYLTLPNIERYFLPQKEAQELEKKLNSNKFIARVTLKVWRGKARIVHLDLEKIF